MCERERGVFSGIVHHHYSHFLFLKKELQNTIQVINTHVNHLHICIPMRFLQKKKNKNKCIHYHMHKNAHNVANKFIHHLVKDNKLTKTR